MVTKTSAEHFRRILVGSTESRIPILGHEVDVADLITIVDGWIESDEHECEDDDRLLCECDCNACAACGQI